MAMAMITQLRPASVSPGNPKGHNLFVTTPDHEIGAGLWVISDGEYAELYRNGDRVAVLRLWPELFNRNGGLKPRGVQLLRRVSEAAYKDGKLGKVY